MITIKNYDSRLALSNYKIGDIYTFYIQNSNIKNLTKIKENDFESHINTLTDAIETNKNIIKNNEQYLNFTHSIGIIIDTHQSIESNKNNYITVMFKTTNNDFVINKYIVNHTSTFI